MRALSVVIIWRKLKYIADFHFYKTSFFSFVSLLSYFFFIPDCHMQTNTYSHTYIHTTKSWNLPSKIRRQKLPTQERLASLGTWRVTSPVHNTGNTALPTLPSYGLEPVSYTGSYHTLIVDIILYSLSKYAHIIHCFVNFLRYRDQCPILGQQNSTRKLWHELVILISDIALKE